MIDRTLHTTTSSRSCRIAALGLAVLLLGALANPVAASSAPPLASEASPSPAAASPIATVGSPGAAAKQESVQLRSPDGQSFSGLVAGPAGSERAVLLLHDWFGISEMTREATTRLAEAGYRVLALDLYGGRSATTHPEATELMNSVDRPTRDTALGAALDHLAAPGRRTAIVGFSMGGFEAYRAATLSTEPPAAVVIVYGGGFEQGIEEMRSRPVPLLSITGSNDAWALDSSLAAMSALAPAGEETVAATLELHVFPGARHGYAQPLFAGGANYDREATRVTWLLLEDFLARHTGPSMTP